MLFNSFDFAIFLPIVFIIYWFVVNKNLKLQNAFIMLASYLFYGWWDWRFLSLILLSSFVDYFVAIGIENKNKQGIRQLLLALSIIVNLGLLGFFKYYNFFVDSFVDAFSMFGYQIGGTTLRIILPVGISFYTFQTMSYTIDVYRKEITPYRGIVAFMAYVSFFPQLVAGPIERAKNLLPQFHKTRVFNATFAKEGFNQMVWGLFKKIAIADSCGVYVDEIFSGLDRYPSYVLLFGVFFFSTQIYADFSGYSDIAIGVAKMFGFKLKTNFRMPNFSRDAAEYWRRWHISLSTWFRDYVYIPLGGSRVQSKWMQARNVMIIFLISGFWHGADWTFIIWGGLNGLLFLPLILSGRNRTNLNVVAEGKKLPSFKEIFQVFTTFTLISLTRIFFRSQDMGEASLFIKKLFSMDNMNSHFLSGGCQRYFYEIIPLIIIFYSIEWVARERVVVVKKNYELALVIILILLFGEFSSRVSFIYFQF